MRWILHWTNIDWWRSNRGHGEDKREDFYCLLCDESAVGRRRRRAFFLSIAGAFADAAGERRSIVSVKKNSYLNGDCNYDECIVFLNTFVKLCELVSFYFFFLHN
jgi:hypothetical protein